MPVAAIVCKRSPSERWIPPSDIAEVAAERIARRRGEPPLDRAVALLRMGGPGWRWYLREASEHGRLSAVDREAMGIVGVTVDDMYNALQK